MIAHGNSCFCTDTLDRHIDLAAARRILDRIRKQIGEDLHESVHVHAHEDVCRFGIKPCSYIVLTGVSAITFNGLFDERPEFNPLHLKFDLARLHLLDIEDVVNQADKPLAVGMRDSKQSHGGIGQFARWIGDKQPERCRN